MDLLPLIDQLVIKVNSGKEGEVPTRKILWAVCECVSNKDAASFNAAQQKLREQIPDYQLDLAGINFFGKDFENFDLTNLNLSRCTFDGAKLFAVHLNRSNLNDATFVGATMREAEFSRAKLRRADFTDAALEGAIFKDADLQGADLSRANMQNVRHLTTEQICRTVWLEAENLPQGLKDEMRSYFTYLLSSE